MTETMKVALRNIDRDGYCTEVGYRTARALARLGLVQFERNDGQWRVRLTNRGYLTRKRLGFAR